MLHVLILLVIAGFLLYLVERFVPMSPPVATVLRVAVVIALLLYTWRAFGLRI